MSLGNLSNQKLEEKFELFLFNMDDCLNQLTEKATRQGFNLDFSVGSLKNVESFLLKNKTTVNDDDYNDLSAYVGEVIRKNYGGKWICNLDKELNSLYFGFPVVEGHSEPNVLLSPFHLVKAFILRQKSNLFIDAIESQVNPKKIDWSKFPTEN